MNKCLEKVYEILFIKKFLNQEWQKVKLIKKKYISDDTLLLTFYYSKNPIYSYILGLDLGKHILVKINNNIISKNKEYWNNNINNEEYIIRKYTPIKLDYNTFDLLIKIYRPTNNFIDGGKMGRHIENLNINDYILVKGPCGRINIENILFNKKINKLILIAGGSGITPIYQVITYIIKKKLNINMTLIYANKTFNDILLLDELLNYSKYLNLIFFLENYNNNLNYNYYNKYKLLKGYITENIIEQDINNLYLLCGPPPMINCVNKFIKLKNNIIIL
tara:strand:- start:3266 stop:4096 length:831 start_codon:yes stop_codon:yes gene_type:complete